MWYRLPKELETLHKAYQNATTREDRQIKLKIREIIACYDECSVDEREFADEIIIKFCQLIRLLKQQPEAEQLVQYAERGSDLQKFLSFREDDTAYHRADQLLDAFYQYALSKKSAATTRDYVARIKTFAGSEQYLGAMLESGALGVKAIQIDPVLFTFRHIELILAKFQTKDSNGRSVKQRLNIRSALRLLNEFKCAQAARKQF